MFGGLYITPLILVFFVYKIYTVEIINIELLRQHDLVADNDNNFEVILDEEMLYFNRVPKTGSENFVFILQKLSEMNGFRHSRFGNPHSRRLNFTEQEKHVHKVLGLSKPLSYDRHVYFVDFRRFFGTNPIWFSMVRNPVEKFASRFYYARQIPNLVARKKEEIAKLFGNKSDQVFEMWKNLSVEECVLRGFDECVLRIGHFYDLSIVSANN